MRLAHYALFLCLAASAYAGPVLTLDPFGGGLTGNPGQTVGWGFEIDNSNGYLVVTGSNFITSVPIGTYTDFISQYNFIVVGPSPESPSVSQAFDNVGQTGVGSYAIDASAAANALSSGEIQITYDLY